jgi:MFS family permease
VQGRVNYWAISAFWLGVSVHWAAFLTIAMQARVNDLAPFEQRGAYLAWLAAAGAFISTVIELIAGPISDRCTSRMGRRRPFILWGTLLSLPFVVLFMTTQSFALLILHFVAIQLFLNWANGPYQAVIPDYVPAHRHGLASAYMGMMTLAGNLIGLALAGALLGEPPLIGGHLERGVRLQIVGFVLVGFLLTTMLWTVLGMREPPWQPRTPDEKRLRWTLFVNILLNEQPNFRWVVVSRFVFNLGFFTALFFLEFYLRDTIGLEGAAPQHAFGFMATATLAGVLGNWLAGVLADRISKKRIIYACIALMCLCAALFLTARGLSDHLRDGRAVRRRLGRIRRRRLGAGEQPRAYARVGALHGNLAHRDDDAAGDCPADSGTLRRLLERAVRAGRRLALAICACADLFPRVGIFTRTRARNSCSSCRKVGGHVIITVGTITTAAQSKAARTKGHDHETRIHAGRIADGNCDNRHFGGDYLSGGGHSARERPQESVFVESEPDFRGTTGV